MAIFFYEDNYYLFSNWSAHQIFFNNTLYPTAEHAYHAQKFIDTAIRDEITSAKSPFLAKEIAHENIKKQIAEWDEIKISVMTDVIKAKLQQHAEVFRTLRESGDEEIIENSPVDYFWGCGEDKSGRNELGKIWMKLREEIKNQ